MGNVRSKAKKLTNTEDDAWAAEHLSSLQAELTARLGPNNTSRAVALLLAARLPKFFYFADYQSLPGHIDINELQGEETPGETGMQTARALLKLASTDAASLTNEDFEDRKAELETVSNEITEEVLTF